MGEGSRNRSQLTGISRSLWDWDSKTLLGAASDEKIARYKENMAKGIPFVEDTHFGFKYRYYVVENSASG